MQQSNGPITQQLRQLRKDSTPAEKLLWKTLRDRRFFGFKFKRQHFLRYSKGDLWSFYIADFYCPEKKLVIELDGNIHDNQQMHDAFRDQMLYDLGIEVIRFKNEELNQMRMELAVIEDALNRR